MSAPREQSGEPDGVDPVDRSPTVLSSGLALAAAAVAAVAGQFSVVGIVVCVIGIAIMGAGLVTARRTFVRLAGAALLGGVLFASASGADVFATLVGVTAALLSFDFAATAVDLGEQLGRGTPTWRVELLHATTSTLVGFGFVLAGSGINEAATGGQPVSAVFGLVVAVVVLLAALRRAEPVE